MCVHTQESPITLALRKNLQSDSDHKMFKVQRQINRCGELRKNFRLRLKINQTKAF